MARAIWSGSISFGLLNVPVKLYSAVARRRHRACASSASPTAPGSATARRRGDRRGGPLREDRQGLRDHPGPVRADHARTSWPRSSRRRPARSRSRTSSTSTRSTRSTSTAPTTSAPPRAPRRPTRCSRRRWRTRGKVAIARFVFRNKEHLAAIRADGRRPDPDHDALRRRGRAARRARRRAPRGDSRRSAKKRESRWPSS